VLAFGNMRLASMFAKEAEDARCQGTRWNGVACTCTPISTLMRAEMTRHPDNRGKTRDSLESSIMPILPVALHGFTHWDERPIAARGLTPGLVRALRDRVPEKAVVFSDDATSYAIAAFAPVYVANALPGHVADTKANRPYARRADAREFFRTGNLAIPRRYGATWLVVDRNRSKLRPDLPQAYSVPRYVLYRLNS